jgi:hypothetical protein
VWIARREHQQPALTVFPDEREPEPRLCLNLPTVTSPARDRRRHGTGQVRGGIQETGLDYLPLKTEHGHPARLWMSLDNVHNVIK